MKVIIYVWMFYERANWWLICIEYRPELKLLIETVYKYIVA